jgi:predicted dehydrogenase
MLGVGIIGCGNISTSYLRLGPLFKGFEIRAVADMNAGVAKARAAEFSVRAETVDALLAAKDIDLIVNLTIPDAHFSVTKSILTAGKHAYSEKPFVLSVAEGEELRAICKAKGLRIGSAPDTFLGGSHQIARRLIDEGRIGKITGGSAAVLNHGMEHWHPNPDFFFLPGAGPMLDLGPYYVTNLIQLIGPVKRVGALATSAYAERTILTEGPRKGQKVPVKTPTNIHALLEFVNGATVSLSTSWDVRAHRRVNMEIYGTDGSLTVPDPNMFSGTVEIAGIDGNFAPVPDDGHPLGVHNSDHPAVGTHANYRTAGLADMAIAISEGRPHRCSLELALHAVEVMTACLKSGETGQFVTMTTSCDRPASLSGAEARALMK